MTDKAGYNIRLTTEQLREAPQLKRRRYAAFDRYRRDTEVSGYYTGLGFPSVW